MSTTPEATCPPNRIPRRPLTLINPVIFGVSRGHTSARPYRRRWLLC